GFIYASDDGAADVLALESLHPLRRARAADGLAHGVDRRHRIPAIVSQRLRQLDCRAEVRPELVLERRGGEEAAVGGSIDLVARAATGQQLAPRPRPVPGRGAVPDSPI